MLPRLAALALTGLSALPASAQGLQQDCVANGMIQVVGITAMRAPNTTRPDAFTYRADLLGSLPFRKVLVSLNLRGQQLLYQREVELPPGRVVSVPLGTFQNTMSIQAQIRSGLRVSCEPA